MVNGKTTLTLECIQNDVNDFVFRYINKTNVKDIISKQKG